MIRIIIIIIWNGGTLDILLLFSSFFSYRALIQWIKPYVLLHLMRTIECAFSLFCGICYLTKYTRRFRGNSSISLIGKQMDKNDYFDIFKWENENDHLLIHCLVNLFFFFTWIWSNIAKIYNLFRLTLLHFTSQLFPFCVFFYFFTSFYSFQQKLIVQFYDKNAYLPNICIRVSDKKIAAALAYHWDAIWMKLNTILENIVYIYFSYNHKLVK